MEIRHPSRLFYPRMENEIKSPYNAIDSASATKISALPIILESSLSAPIAADAALATATPAPIQESPVDSAAAMYLHPSAADAAVSDGA